MKNTQSTAKKIEVRSQTNDRVVMTFEHTEQQGTNIVTAGYNRIMKAFGIDRMNAENRYYVHAE